MMELLCTLSNEQQQLLQQLFSRGSFKSLQKCINGIDALEEFQQVAIAYAVIAKSCLLNIDTGLGKTLIAAGIINVLRTLKPKLKWVYLCQCSNLKTTARKLSKHLVNMEITYCDSTESQILKTFFTRRAETSDVLVLSYEAIVQPSVESFLFRNRDIYQGLILDESQMLSNLSSHTSRLVSAITNTAVYKILLSATPLRINIEQVVNQIYMIDREMFSQINMSTFLNQYRIWDDKEIVGYRNLQKLQFQLMPRMLSFSRTDLEIRGNYVPSMRICKSGLEEDEPSTSDIISYKSSPGSSTLRELVSLVRKYKIEGKHGLIYANRNVLKKAILSALSSEGDISCDIMDGSHTSTQKSKDAVHKAFLDKELDVLITNITTGKDLPCDYIIFYELTFDYKQMIGRGERGLNGVALDVIFILTDTLNEMRFFYTNVYQRGILLEKLCAKDLPELHLAMDQLKNELIKRGMNLEEE